jgi:hypothetical protein
VRIIHPPRRNSRKPWPKRLRRWVATIRQIVESVYDKLFNTFGLWRERSHELEGLRARLAARVALHNFSASSLTISRTPPSGLGQLVEMVISTHTGPQSCRADGGHCCCRAMTTSAAQRAA